MLKKILCIAAALCGFTGLAHGALTYTQTPALFLGGGGKSYNDQQRINDQRIATNGAGLTVVVFSAPAVWDSNRYQYKNGIFIQRYDASGNPSGSLVRIDPCETCYSESLIQPTVAIDPVGRYIVTWRKETYGSIFARFYDEQGKLTKETELLKQSDLGGTSKKQELRMDANGNFVVVYDLGIGIDPQYDIFARRFNAEGGPLGEVIKVSVNTASDTNPTLEVSGDGAFAVAWQRARTTGCADSQYSKPGQCDDILLRRFDNQGAPLGNESKVADGKNNLDQTPSIAMDNQGNFVVAWDRYRDLCENMLQCDDILAQRYSAAGAKLGGAIAVIANTNQNDTEPQAAMDGNGKFVVMWNRGDVLFRAYDADGLSLGGAVSYRVASGLSTSELGNYYPHVSISDTGKMNVIWSTTVPSNMMMGTTAVLVFRQMVPSAW